MASKLTAPGKAFKGLQGQAQGSAGVLQPDHSGDGAEQCCSAA